MKLLAARTMKDGWFQITIQFLQTLFNKNAFCFGDFLPVQTEICRA